MDAVDQLNPQELSTTGTDLESSASKLSQLISRESVPGIDIRRTSAAGAVPGDELVQTCQSHPEGYTVSVYFNGRHDLTMHVPVQVLRTDDPLTLFRDISHEGKRNVRFSSVDCIVSNVALLILCVHRSNGIRARLEHLERGAY